MRTVIGGKTWSDEVLAIGGGIGIIVMLFALWQKYKAPAAASSTPSTYPVSLAGTSAAATPDESAGITEYSGSPLRVSIGPTNMGSQTINIGQPQKALFPYFGYAADASSNASAYQLASEMMRNNAGYQGLEANSNANYNQIAAQTADTRAQYQANARQNQGK